MRPSVGLYVSLPQSVGFVSVQAYFEFHAAEESGQEGGSVSDLLPVGFLKTLQRV